MANGILPLFGPTPEELEYKKRQDREALARQDYRDRLAGAGQGLGMYGGLAQQGVRLGENLRTMKLFGEAPSPDMERANVMQDVMNKFGKQDMTNPQVMAQMAKELSDRGYPREAMQFMEEAKSRVATAQASQREGQKQDLETQKLQFEVQKAQREALGGSGETLKEATIGKTIKMVNRVETGMRLASTFEETFSGLDTPRSLANAKKKLDEFDSPENRRYFNWWMDYDTYTSEIRAELFGATLTDNEAKEFEKIKISETDSPKIAKAKLINQSKWARLGLIKLIDGYKNSGYNVSGLEASLRSSEKYLDSLGADISTPPPSTIDEDGEGGGGDWTVKPKDTIVM